MNQKISVLKQSYTCYYNLHDCSFKKHIHGQFKGATKFYFTHYSRVVITLFNTGLSKSVFSTFSFGKLVFFVFLRFLCFLSVCVLFVFSHFGKTFLQLLLLKVCETFLFRENKKACSSLWSVSVFFAFLEKRRPKKYFLQEVNLVFHMQILSLMCQSVNLF